MTMTIALSAVAVFAFAVITMAIFALHGTVTVLLSCKRATVHWSHLDDHDIKKNVNDDKAHDFCKKRFNFLQSALNRKSPFKTPLDFGL